VVCWNIALFLLCFGLGSWACRVTQGHGRVFVWQGVVLMLCGPQLVLAS
jgi:hypothetical protein